jgi:hypothetical protein
MSAAYARVVPAARIARIEPALQGRRLKRDRDRHVRMFMTGPAWHVDGQTRTTGKAALGPTDAAPRQGIEIHDETQPEKVGLARLSEIIPRSPPFLDQPLATRSWLRRLPGRPSGHPENRPVTLNSARKFR